MKVLLVAYGFTEYSLRLAQALGRQHDVTAVVTHEGVARELGGDLTLLPLACSRVVTHRLRKFRDPRWAKDSWNIHRLAEDMDTDVIHVQDSASDVVGLLARISRRPLVVTVHDPKPHSGQDAREGWRRETWRKSLRARADAVIVHGEALKQIMVNDQKSPSNVWVAPHAPLGFGGRQEATASVPTFLLFGRMEAYKGVEEFLAAARLVRERVPTARFVVAGIGSELDRLLGVADGMIGVEWIKRFVPPGELARLFGGASAIVLPYRDATQSGVGALAMGFGRGMIATRVGALPDICIPGQTGVLVPPGNPQALAEAMVEWANSPLASERYGLGAYHLGEGAASWSVAASVATKAYESVTSTSYPHVKAS